MVLCWIE
jgi:hypothetical protein